MKNIGGGIAAPSFSAFGPILLGWNKKQHPKNMCSHVIFVIYFRFSIKHGGAEDFNQFDV
jgi:hypothetical protein